MSQNEKPGKSAPNVVQLETFFEELKKRLAYANAHILSGDGHLIGGGFLRKKRSHSLIGLPGAGKSMAMAHAAILLRTGGKFFGRPVAKAKVAFFACEAADSTLDRLCLLAKRAGLPWPIPGLDVIPGALDLKDPAELAGVIQIIKHLEAETVMFDTANASGTGDEGPGDMSRYAGGFNRMVQATDAAGLVSHHTPMDGQLRERGHGSLRGLLDVSAVVQKLVNVRQLLIGKARDGEEAPYGSFRIEGEQMGKTNLGEDWTIPYLIEVDGAAYVATETPKAVTQTLKDEALVLAIVEELCSQTHDRTCFRAVLQTVFAAKTQNGPKRALNSKTAIVNRSLKALQDVGRVELIGRVGVRFVET